MHANVVPADLDDELHAAAVRRFQHRCIAYGTALIMLVLVWALTGAPVHSSGQGDIQIGPGLWPIWFVVPLGLDLARRARKVFGQDESL